MPFTLEHASFAIGCVNMAASMVFQAIGFHSKKLDEAARKSMERACSIHQVASIGFMILAYHDAPIIPFSMLCVATLLFPGLIYY